MKRRQRTLAGTMPLPSCTNGSHRVTVNHPFPLPLGSCAPAFLLKDMPRDQEQEGPLEFTKGWAKLKENLSGLVLRGQAGSYDFSPAVGQFGARSRQVLAGSSFPGVVTHEVHPLSLQFFFPYSREKNIAVKFRHADKVPSQNLNCFEFQFMHS